MKHVFRAKKMGWDEEQEFVWFDASLYTKAEAEAAFKPYEATNKRGYGYTYYVYDGIKYYSYAYVGLFEDNNLPRNDQDIIDNLVKVNSSR